MQYYQLPLIFCPAKVNPFSIVAAKNYGRKMLILEQQQMCECRDARIVLTMPSRITSMIFVPIRGGIADAMRASGRIILRTRTYAEESFFILFFPARNQIMF